MRTIIILLISMAVLLPATESNPRVTRLMEGFDASATEAQDAYQQAIAKAEADRATALTAARDRTITGLKRLINTRSGVAEQAEVYTQVLRLHRDDADAVRFFTAIGTLEQVLAGLEPVVETDLLGKVAPSVMPQRPIVIRDQNFDIGVLENGSLVAPNRNFQWRDVPEEFRGMRFLRFPFRDNIVSYEVEVLQPGIAFIIVSTFESRLDEQMLIRDGWEDTGMFMRINIGGGHPMKIYGKPFSRGRQTIPNPFPFVRAMLVFGEAR